MKKIIIIFVLLILCSCSVNSNDDVPKEYQSIRYQEVDSENQTQYACITFFAKGEYSMYDCDSEPTNYFFDNENECNYEYDSEDKEIEFDCKYDYSDEDTITNVYFDKDTFKFTIEGEEKTFKSENWINDNIEEW